MDLTQLEKRPRDQRWVLSRSSVTLPHTQNTTHRHLGIIRILIRSHPDRSLNRPRDVPFFGIHLQQLGPRLLRIPRRLETSLKHLLGFFLVMQPQRQIAQDLPFQPRLAVRHVLRFEMRDFGSKDGPDA